jgi:GPH family glycoside/pentoside/hexuronide:cation symporter
MMVFAVIAVAFFWGCFLLTRERVKPISPVQTSVVEDVKDLLSNKPWWILLAAAIAALIFNSIRDGAAIYYFKYYVGHNIELPFGLSAGMSLATLYLLLGQGANIIGVVFAPSLAKRIGKKMTFFSAMFLASVLSLLFFIPHQHNIPIMLVLQVLISICAGSIFPLLWSMYADIADFSEWKTGRRATGLIFSSSSMAQKFGWTIGGATTGWLLGYFGFMANVEQNSGALTGIKSMLSLFPAAGALLSAIAVLFYPLSEEKLKVITQALGDSRREVKL